MQLEIYHGSALKNVVPSMCHESSDKEYGKGFYTTFSKEKAKQWAVVSNPVLHEGYVHKYTLETEGLKVLYAFKYCNLMETLALVANNKEYIRNMMSTKRMAKKVIDTFYKEEYAGYDVIVGHRFDARYMQFIERILRGSLSVEVAKKHFAEMVSHDEELVVVLKTQKAFDRLKISTEAEAEYIDNPKYVDEYAKCWDEVLKQLQKLDLSEDNKAEDNLQHVLRKME